MEHLTPQPHHTVSEIFKTHADALESLHQQNRPTKGGPSVTELEFAATLLLVELASSDHNYSRSEHMAIFNGVRRLFGGSGEKIESLISEARAYLQGPRSTAHFSTLLRDFVPEHGRVAIIAVVDLVIDSDGIEEGIELYVRNKFVRQLGLENVIPPRMPALQPEKKGSGNAPPDRSRFKNDEWP